MEEGFPYFLLKKEPAANKDGAIGCTGKRLYLEYGELDIIWRFIDSAIFS